MCRAVGLAAVWPVTRGDAVVLQHRDLESLPDQLPGRAESGDAGADHGNVDGEVTGRGAGSPGGADSSQ